MHIPAPNPNLFASRVFQQQAFEDHAYKHRQVIDKTKWRTGRYVIDQIGLRVGLLSLALPVCLFVIILSSSVSSSYSSPPWLGAVKFFRPPFFAFPIISPSSLPLHSGGAWLWGWFSRRRVSISPPCGRFKDGSRIEAPSSLSVAFACLGNALQLDHSIERRYI
jgi:hypothetical protein